MTNNPFKVRALERLGVVITTIIPIIVSPNTYNQHYLQTKAERMSHALLGRKNSSSSSTSTSTSRGGGLNSAMAPRRRKEGRSSSSSSSNSSNSSSSIGDCKYR